MARIGARPAGADRLRRRGPGGQAARGGRVRARNRARGRDVAPGGRSGRGAAGPRLSRAGDAARRQPGALSPRWRAASRFASWTAASSGASERATKAELLARVQQAPQTFSPNVLLRPLVQDTLFPTVCYVAGPNELAYLGQLGGVYEAFGVPMPLIQQRATATLARLQRHAVPRQARFPARIAAGAGRGGAEPAARSAAAAGVEASLRRCGPGRGRAVWRR